MQRFLSFLLVPIGLAAAAAAPIRLHPDNPHWFEWRGRALALITSAEHYGAVLNPDFDFRRYLETLERAGMNYTRIFTGSYVEPPGAFGIERNTLAPAAGRFLAPWARSEEPGYAGGGNKFDLDRFAPEYLTRLKEVVGEAGRRGIVVEVTLFCSTYGEAQWAVHPLNPTNNVQAVPVADWRKLNTTATGPAIMAVQERLTRWLVQELNGSDNVFFEIQNEPWADNHTMGDFINPYLPDQHRWPNAVEVTTAESVAWQRAIARCITAAEALLPQRHLIAQNVANFRLPVRESDLVPEAAIVNFHYAYPEAVDWNRGLGRVIGYDETGFAGRDDATYRRQAWNFVFSGGGLFNSLDYSFTVGREDGTDTANRAPGGGGPALRRQLRVLADFLGGFDLAGLRPDPQLIEHAPGLIARVLSQPGRAHGLYLQGRGGEAITLRLASGRWTAEWLSVEDGRVLQHEEFSCDGQPVRLTCPEFTDAVALRILLESTAATARAARPSSNEAIVRHYFDQFVNRLNESTADALIATNLVMHHGEVVSEGLDSFKQALAGLHAAFPDVRFEVEDLVSTGDKVVARWLMTGTQQGDYGGQPASGKPVRVTGMSLFQLRDGKIEEIWVNMDRFEFLRQLGLVKTPFDH